MLKLQTTAQETLQNFLRVLIPNRLPKEKYGAFVGVRSLER